jgi:nucleoside phosphorylase
VYVELRSMTLSARSRLGVLLCLVLAVAGVLARPAGATSAAGCRSRVLVLAAMPLELNPLIEATHLSGSVRAADRTFYSGTLQGLDVVLAMTGIGPTNARQTAEAGLSLPGCRFRAVVFSGVAGSRFNIGDVAVPRRWTLDEGHHWAAVDPAMLKIARTLPSTHVPLSQDVPVGDAACACPGVDAATPVHLPNPTAVHVGGDGASTDPFNGRAVPCVPGGGDIAGCEPCVTAQGMADNSQTFASRVPDGPDVLAGAFSGQASSKLAVDAVDEETAAAQRVAARHRASFLGFRGVSDGKGDPLGLPGFPVQFAYYRQLAANNSATALQAFLHAWRAAGTPTAQSR